MTPDIETAILPDSDLYAMQARCDAASLPPWTGWGMRLHLSGPDTEFATHARTDLPRLIAEVRRLRDMLKPDVTGFHDCTGGVIQRYPRLLCSRCGKSGGEDFDPVEVITRLRAIQAGLHRDRSGVGYVNMEQCARGCTSGNVPEWPVLRTECRDALDEIARLRAELDFYRKENP